MREKRRKGQWKSAGERQAGETGLGDTDTERGMHRFAPKTDAVNPPPPELAFPGTHSIDTATASPTSWVRKVQRKK